MAQITRQQLLDHFKTAQAVADFFGISRQAFYDWGEGPIPELRQLQAANRLPDVFGPEAPPHVQSQEQPPEQGRAAA